MPYIETKTNVTLTEAQKVELKEKFAEAITLIPGKSEEWLMLGFADGFTEEIFSALPVVSIKSSGKFANVIFDGSADEIEEKLLTLSPTVIEQMPIDFEEIFINEVKKEERA